MRLLDVVADQVDAQPRPLQAQRPQPRGRELVALREGQPALHGDDRREELGDRLQIHTVHRHGDGEGLQLVVLTGVAGHQAL